MISLKQVAGISAKELQSLANNERIAKNLKDGFPHPYTIRHARDFQKFSAKGLMGHTFGIYKDEIFIGIGSILPLKDIYRNNAEIGYWIGEPFWGKGFATEAVNQLTQFAFHELHLVRIFAGVFEDNRASMRVLEKAGYHLESVSKSAITKYGKIFDEYMYVRLNEEPVDPRQS